MKRMVSEGGGFVHHTKNEVDLLGSTHRYPFKLLAHIFMVWGTAIQEDKVDLGTCKYLTRVSIIS